MPRLQIPTSVKSTLRGFKYQFVGFSFYADSALGCYVQVTFFRQQSPANLNVIGVSHYHRHPPGDVQAELTAALGNIVDGDEIMPSVERGIPQMPFEKFRQLMSESLQHEITWLPEEKLVAA